MRLSHQTIRPTGTPITFHFDGQEIAALEGETIAAALSAAGIVAFRRTASGAPRGLHCGMGACFDCLVTVDGRIGQRACMTKVAAGMRVATESDAAVDARRGVLQFLLERYPADHLINGGRARPDNVRGPWSVSTETGLRRPDEASLSAMAHSLYAEYAEQSV